MMQLGSLLVDNRGRRGQWGRQVRWGHPGRRGRKDRRVIPALAPACLDRWDRKGRKVSLDRWDRLDPPVAEAAAVLATCSALKILAQPVTATPMTPRPSRTPSM